MNTPNPMYLQQVAANSGVGLNPASGNLSIPNFPGNIAEKTQNMYTFNNNFNMFNNSLLANPNSLGNQHAQYSFNMNNSMKSSMGMNKDFVTASNNFTSFDTENQTLNNLLKHNLNDNKKDSNLNHAISKLLKKN